MPNSNKPSKRAKKSKYGQRTVTQRTRDREYISRLYLQGYRLDKISQIMNERVLDPKSEVNYTVSRTTIFRDIEAIRKAWEQSTIFNFDKFLNIELAKLDTLEYEAWNAWIQSKGKRVKQSVRHTKEAYDVPKTEVNQEGELEENTDVQFLDTSRSISQHTYESPGDPRFLVVLTKISERRLRLLGDTYQLYLERKAKIVNKDGEEESLSGPQVSFSFPHNKRKEIKPKHK